MFGLFKKKPKLDWILKIEETGKEVTVNAGDNLLKGALEAGVRWPHDCRVGSCGTCKCKLKQGQIKELSDFGYVLSQEELEDGMILACQSELQSDVVIEVDLLKETEQAINITSHPGVIQRITPLTHDIVELVIEADDRFPRSALAGQYAEVAVSHIDKPRSYSFAKAPENEVGQEITFFVRRVPNGEFTEWLFSKDRTDEPIEVTGPNGTYLSTRH